MITPEQADKLAQTTMQDYVKACHCENNQDVANVLMKLASMCGLGMCAVVGQPEAVARMQGTADHVAKTQSGRHWTRGTLQ